MNRFFWALISCIWHAAGVLLWLLLSLLFAAVSRRMTVAVLQVIGWMTSVSTSLPYDPLALQRLEEMSCTRTSCNSRNQQQRSSRNSKIDITDSRYNLWKDCTSFVGWFGLVWLYFFCLFSCLLVYLFVSFACDAHVTSSSSWLLLL